MEKEIKKMLNEIACSPLHEEDLERFIEIYGDEYLDGDILDLIDEFDEEC